MPEIIYPKRAFKFKMVEGQTSARQARYVMKKKTVIFKPHKQLCVYTVFNNTKHIFFSPGATTPIGGCILQPSSGL